MEFEAISYTVTQTLKNNNSFRVPFLGMMSKSNILYSMIFSSAARLTFILELGFRFIGSLRSLVMNSPGTLSLMSYSHRDSK